MPMPLGGIFAPPQQPVQTGVLGLPAAPGWMQSMGNGIANSQAMLMALGSGMLAHRQNANNPIVNPQTMTQAMALDEQRKTTKEEKARELAAQTATEKFLISKGFSPEDAAAAKSNKDILNFFLKEKETNDPNIVNAGDGMLYNADTKEWITAPNAGQPSADDIRKAEGDLRGEFTKLPQFKRFDDVHAGYKRIKSSASQDSGPGDIGVIFGYMKMLDPTSTVREGEVASAEQAAGVPAQVLNLYNRAVSGERLTPKQRKDFLSAAQGLYDQEASSLREVGATFDTLATDYGVDPSRVSIQIFESVEERTAMIVYRDEPPTLYRLCPWTHERAH